MISGWERTAHRNFELHRMQTTKTVYITEPTSTNRTPWRGDQALYENSVFCSKIHNPDKLLATRYICIQWT